MLIPAGKESEYSKEELKSLKVTTDYEGNVTNFPKVDYGWHVACAYNQFGMNGMAKMFICQSIEDMNELVRNYHMGGALRMDWYAVPDTHFVKIMSVEEWQSGLKGNKSQSSPSFFKANPNNIDSSEDKQNNMSYN
ncbi:hypothetical protein Lsai_0815 [Legionella sainthelensi]|uniref:Uncharacterized protein n=1 Tax=Legionella sainthelensi TaxID=28087 RepID=A0A0W0YMT2_9GAMM|nr:hypothetical protein [Legionella sainthelensi]KTD58208.1 hypothetical protein Lsai_0815 [Legionella sainthelensi]VEH26815.1 Uncharacterised protein [Legionella sainthelensi]